MIYSSGMPLLYLVGVVQFYIMYWVDKFLFIRVYRKPPSYGIELASIARNVIVYSIILHLCFGFYMFSNSAIFTYEEDFLYLDWVKDQFEDDLSSIISSNNYLSVQRIMQTHTLIYIIGAALILLIFIIAEMVGACCKDSWKKCCCCCFDAKRHQELLDEAFSDNIYKELSIEDLRSEYKKTKTELSDLDKMASAGMLPADQAKHLNIQLLNKL